ncbi:hypothetical protein [Pseudoduganella violaceinigra]|uniref:hypothetical protein n=1 Tax=Pseudoduganella violaceinigra TaxID=246602 RepID=UPI0004857CCF|nr:hypothetical protein [Pseudoduganella violaceinigra]
MPLFLFVIGLLILPSIFFLHEQTRFVLAAVEVFWGLACFWVVSENYKRKTELMTRGGRVTFESNPTAYKSVYVIVYFFGVAALLILLLVTLFPKDG